MPTYTDILKKIEISIEKFNKKIPGIQKGMLEGIVEELQKLDLRNGKIKTTVANLRLITRIKNKLNKLILTDDYFKEVKDFAKSFNEITKLQNAYWQQVEKDFKPKTLLKEIKNQAISDTVDRLTESGLNANLVNPIADILKTNVTTGGSYRALTAKLTQSLTDTNTPGLLSKYAGTVTVDSINTYNAQYTQIVSSDLGFQWYRYANTLIETSRPFCQSMIEERQYFHITEIPALLRAENMYYTDEDGVRKKVPIYDKTGLPHGMKEGTDAANFLINRGGWKCGHATRPVSEGVVPKDIVERVKATPAYKRWNKTSV